MKMTAPGPSRRSWLFLLRHRPVALSKLLAPAHMARINKRAKKEISDMREAPISTTKAKTRVGN